MFKTDKAKSSNMCMLFINTEVHIKQKELKGIALASGKWVRGREIIFISSLRERHGFSMYNFEKKNSQK